MFNISLDTDYALRLVLALAQDMEWHEESAVAKQMHLYGYQQKAAIARLKQAGFICERDGMCKLNARPEALSLYDVIKAVEGDIHINRCLEDDKFCSRDATDFCVMRSMYMTLQESIINALKSKTMVALLETDKLG